mgnify:CR=1 FL=1
MTVSLIVMALWTSAVLAAGAWAADRLLRSARLQTRLVWAMAMATSVALVALAPLPFTRAVIELSPSPEARAQAYWIEAQTRLIEGSESEFILALEALDAIVQKHKDMVGLVEKAAALASDVRWRAHGSIESMVLPAVKKQPLGIPGAHFVHGIKNLRAASRNHPAILGFNWDGGGGHFVVCVGPSKTDPSLFVILDPDGGLQYLSADDATGNAFYYNPSYGARGKIDPIGYIVT